MKLFSLRVLLIACCSWASVALHAADPASITVVRPWARATVPGAANGAVYMTLRATGSAPDRLVSAKSPVAESVELHVHKMEGGVMQMRAVEAIDVAPGKPAVLAPGGLHLMLFGLRHSLVEGSTFPLTLDFERSGTVTIEIPVLARGAP
ncbi:MAG TPA: copper chaperone PCu(A)C [Caldimonas sp.]|nr:copper chaperone PCu(A)C [Caldimonas sp.]